MHVNIMAITDLHSSLPESHKYINRQTENLHQKYFLKRKKMECCVVQKACKSCPCKDRLFYISNF